MGLIETAAEDAATAAVPELALPLRILGWCKSGLSAAVTWIAASTTHLLLATLAASAVLNLWQWHHVSASNAKGAKALAVETATFAAEKKAFGSLLTSYHTVLAAIVSENATIEHAARLSAKVQATAAKAAASAQAAGAKREATAAALDAAAAKLLASTCRTPAEVMAKKGEI